VGKVIDEHINEGKIVTSSITVQLLRDAMVASGEKRFLIDGFPRSEENLNTWLENMNGVATIKHVIFLDLTEDAMVERVLKRGALGSNRSDDNEDVVRKRLQTYTSSTMPIIDHFTKEGKTLRIDGSGSVEEVFSLMAPHLVQRGG